MAAVGASARAQTAKQQKVDIDWDKVVVVSKSTPTLQVVTNPMLNPGSPIHDGSFSALKALGADYVRYVPWLPYPKIAVAELEAPTKEKTSWDFTYIDPVTKDFLAATDGHSTIINFSTIPAWMFKTDQPVKYPDDPNQVFWDYTKGTELRDPSGKELGDYFGRLVSWYTKGGFTDENGKRHDSGNHYTFPYLGGTERDRLRTHHHSGGLHEAVRRDSGGHSQGKPKHEVHGSRAGGAGRQSKVLRVLSQSEKSQARHSARLHFVPLLCQSRDRRESRRLAAHVLQSGRRIPRYDAIYSRDSRQTIAADEDRRGRIGVILPTD